MRTRCSKDLCNICTGAAKIYVIFVQGAAKIYVIFVQGAAKIYIQYLYIVMRHQDSLKMLK